MGLIVPNTNFFITTIFIIFILNNYILGFCQSKRGATENFEPEGGVGGGIRIK